MISVCHIRTNTNVDNRLVHFIINQTTQLCRCGLCASRNVLFIQQAKNKLIYQEIHKCTSFEQESLFVSTAYQTLLM